MTLTLQISHTLRDKFRRWAKANWPNEILVGMYGEFVNGVWRVSGLSEPMLGDRESVEYDPQQWKEDRLFVIGTIHTHCETQRFDKCYASPSYADIDNASAIAERVYGVCAVWKNPNGKMLTNLKFFTSGPALRLI